MSLISAFCAIIMIYQSMIFFFIDIILYILDV